MYDIPEQDAHFIQSAVTDEELVQTVLEKMETNDIIQTPARVGICEHYNQRGVLTEKQRMTLIKAYLELWG